MTQSGIEPATFWNVEPQPTAPPRTPCIATISNVNVVEKIVFKTLENARVVICVAAITVRTVLCVEVEYILWRHFFV
jgi:hypothetical protein